MLEEDADVDDVEDASEEWDNNENVFIVILVVVLVLHLFSVFLSSSLAWSVVHDNRRRRRPRRPRLRAIADKTMSRKRKTKDSRGVVDEGVRVCINSPSTTARAMTKAVMKWETKTHTHF